MTQNKNQPQKVDFQLEYLKHQLQKIDKMTIQDLLVAKRKENQVIEYDQPGSLQYQAKQYNREFGVTQKYVGQITPGQIWTNIGQQVADMKSADFHEQRISPTLNHAKRGRLGIDLYLIAFAAVGIIAIPLYFYFIGKKDRERKVKSRKISPKQIKALDEDSPVSIDDVSEQVIMYYNPERQKKRLEQMRRIQEHNKIMRQIDEM